MTTKQDAINKAVDELDIPPMATYPILSDLYDAGVSSKTTGCVWTHDDYHGKYDTGCGGAWEFTDGTPADNNAKFCPYCGGEIHEYTPPQPQED